jgi:hypothetical protein
MLAEIETCRWCSALRESVHHPLFECRNANVRDIFKEQSAETEAVGGYARDENLWEERSKCSSREREGITTYEWGIEDLDLEGALSKVLLSLSMYDMYIPHKMLGDEEGSVLQPAVSQKPWP